MRKLNPDIQRKVSYAITIIGSMAKRAEIEAAFFYGTKLVRRQKTSKQSGLYGVQTKRQKKAAAKIAVALHRLEGALNSAEFFNSRRGGLLWSVLLDFPMDKHDFETWRKRLDTAANTKLGRPNRTQHAKRVAVELAARLLQKHDLPITTTRGGRLHKLAALFYDDEKADLFRQCCALVNATKV